MVCLSSRSPHAAALLRKAARIADRLGAPWYAVYVQTPRESPENIDAATQREVGNNLELARQLGGTSVPVQGDRPGEHDRLVRQGVRHHALRRRPQPAAVVSLLVRAARCSTVCCRRFPAWTWWSSTTARRRGREGRD